MSPRISRWFLICLRQVSLQFNEMKGPQFTQESEDPSPFFGSQNEKERNIERVPSIFLNETRRPTDESVCQRGI